MKLLRITTVIILSMIMCLQNTAFAGKLDAVKPIIKGTAKGADNVKPKKPVGWWNRGGDEGTSAKEKSPEKHASGNDHVNDPSQDINVTNLDNFSKIIDPNPNIKAIDVFLRNLSDVLMRKKKSAAIIVAEAGTGKSAVAEGLAHAVVEERPIVSNLHGHEIRYLYANKIMSNTQYVGQSEKRISQFTDTLEDLDKRSVKNKIDFVETEEEVNERARGIIDTILKRAPEEVKEADEKPIVFIVDELEEILKSKQGMKLLEGLKTYLTQEMGVGLIFNITPGPFNKLMKDPQLIRRLFKLVKDPPDDDTVRNILEGVRDSIHKENGVYVNNTDLEKIFLLSKQHPELKNPDAALTILEDATIAAVSDSSKGSKRVTELTERIIKRQGTIARAEKAKQMGLTKFFGPYYKHKIDRLTKLNDEHQRIVDDFNDSYAQTNEIRKEWLNKVRMRRRLYEDEKYAEELSDFGDSAEDIMDAINDDIDDLARQIKTFDGLLTSDDVKQEHVVSAAAAFLNRDPKAILSIMNDGPSISGLTDKLANGAKMARASIEAFAERVITRADVLGQKKGAQNIIFISEDPSAVSEVSERLAQDYSHVKNAFFINGEGVQSEADMIDLIGLKNSETEGSLHKYQKESGGTGIIYLEDPHLSGSPLQSRWKNIVVQGQDLSNQSRTVDYSRMTVISSVRIPGLNTEQMQTFNSFRSEAQRQAFAKKFLAENGIKIDPAILKESTIIFAQSDNLTDVSRKTLFIDRIKDEITKLDFSSKHGVDLFMSDELADYLFEIALEVGGDYKELVSTDVAPAIRKLSEAGKIVDGDQVELTVGVTGEIIVGRKVKWDDNSMREATYQEALAGRKRVI